MPIRFPRNFARPGMRPARFAGCSVPSPLCGGAEPTYRPSTAPEAPSFELWCCRSSFTRRRCDARNSGDTENYEHYRALTEQFAQTSGGQEERDRELMDRLDRDPRSKPGDWEGLQ